MDHSELRRLVVEGNVTATLNYISGLEEQHKRALDVLHMALDWVGRVPEDARSSADMKSIQASIADVLKSR